MAKRPVIEIEEKKISTSFKFTEPTVQRLKELKTIAKNKKLGRINIDSHVEEKLHDVLDDMEILLSDHGHVLGERLAKKKNKKKPANPPPIPSPETQQELM